AEVAVCSIVKVEMFYGSLRSTNPERSLRIQQQFFSQFESLPFDDNSARIAARIRAELAAAGRIIGAYDILISSIVIANDLIRVTHNLSEFSRVSGLKIEDWEV
ncbi:MAG: PIN domain-containing protein, partial [Pyrinomonadaceae bacterium]